MEPWTDVRAFLYDEHRTFNPSGPHPMTVSPARRPVVWFSVVSLAAGLFLSGCSQRNTTPLNVGTGPAAVEAENPSPPMYPIDTCVVSGEKLGSMGEIYVVDVRGRAVKLCCAGCEAQLLADPAKYLAMLDEAADQSAPTADDSHKKDGQDHEGHDHD